MADKELYKVCAVEVKRQIWQDNQALFGDEVSPLLKQYIVEKEAALFSSDLSILHNFFSPSPKTRRQGEVSHSRRVKGLTSGNQSLRNMWNDGFVVAGGPKTDPDDRKEREAVRHGAAVFTNTFPANTKCPLLHAESRTADVSARPGHQWDLHRRPLP